MFSNIIIVTCTVQLLERLSPATRQPLILVVLQPADMSMNKALNPHQSPLE